MVTPYNDAALLIDDPLQPIGEEGSERDVEERYAHYLTGLWQKALVLRQKKLPSGLRPDILVYIPTSKCLAVIELKRGAAAHRHVSQLRRYMRELQRIHGDWRVIGQLVADALPGDVVQMNEDLYFTRPGPRPIQFERGPVGVESSADVLARIQSGLERRRREIN